LLFEYLFDRAAEGLGELKGQRQRRVVPFSFDCVDGLARDSDPFGQLLLAPFTFGPQFTQAVFHRWQCKVCFPYNAVKHALNISFRSIKSSAKRESECRASNQGWR